MTFEDVFKQILEERQVVETRVKKLEKKRKAELKQIVKEGNLALDRRRKPKKAGKK